MKELIKWMWCSCAALWWSALAIAAAIEPAATVTLTVEAARPGRCELAISEDALIERLSAILPDPITRDDFNHADVALKLGDKIVGGYELVVADENLVKDGRFELPMEKSPWNGLRRREYSLKPEPGQPGKVFWIESDKIQNTRLSQRVQLKKDRLYLLSYAGYSDVQAYDFAVQLVDPARKYNAQLPHSHKRPLHHQQRWARYQHLVRADIEAPELWIGTALKGRAGVTDIQLHPARWRLVADAPRAGAQQFTLAYVPRMGRHMTPPTSEPKPDSTLPPAKVTLGKVEMVAPNPDGVLVKTPSGEAWTLPGDWPLRIDRLRDSRPPAPAARHEVTVARGVDATILLALDLKSSGFKLDSLRCDLPVKVLALRLASVPVNRFGNMDEVVYRQLDPMVEVNDPLVPFDPGVPTVLALTIQCAETTPAGTHDGEIELKLLTGSGDIPVAASGQNKTATGMSPLPVRLPIRVRVLPVTAQPIKHFGTCFGNQHLLASYAKGDTYTEHGIPVADFHGLDRKTRATPAGADALRKLARDYIHRMLDFDIEPHAPTMLAGFTYKVVENPNGGPPKLTDWDFAEFDRSLEMFARRGLRDICVDHSNGDILNTKRLINQVTYSYTPPPKPNAPRWRQLSEDEFWRLVGDYYEQFASHLAAKGWLDGAYILLDESSVASDPVIRRFAQTLRAQPHARQLRLLNTHYHTAIYTSRLNGGHDGPLTMEGVLDVFVPQNNDHYNFWPEDDIWPRDRGPLPKHWVYYTETDHLDLPHAGLSTELMALKCRWLGAQGMLIWGSFVWSMPYKRTDERDWGGGTSGPVMNPWINPNYAHGQGLLSFFYPPDPRGPAKEPTLKITPSYRWALLRDGLQDNALWEIAKAGVDDAGKPVRVPETVRCSLQSQLDATFINPVQWRVSRPHHHAWRDALYRSVQQTKP